MSDFYQIHQSAPGVIISHLQCECSVQPAHLSWLTPGDEILRLSIRRLKARRTAHRVMLEELQVYKSALTLVLSLSWRQCRPQQCCIACGLRCLQWYLGCVWQDGHQGVWIIKTSLPELGAVLGMMSPADLTWGIFREHRRWLRTHTHSIKSWRCNKSDAGQSDLTAVVREWKQITNKWSQMEQGGSDVQWAKLAFLKNQT